MTNVIEVKNLRKVYGQTTAVDDISFTVQQGEIFGIVGPNGAGKTTTIESIVGLRKPDAGSISVLGMDPQTESQALGNRIGTQLQQAALPDRMKVWEALDLYASFYKQTVPWEPLLEQWGLADKRDTQFGNLSGGQKQRLFISLALLNDPEIVFLDELTTGLDPQARRATWDLVRAIREQGKTVVLITHYMDEIEALADRVAIIDHGRRHRFRHPGQSHCRSERRNPGALHRPQWLSAAAVKRGSRRHGRRSTAAADHRPRHWAPLGQGCRCPGPRQHCPHRPACAPGQSGRCLSGLDRTGTQGLIIISAIAIALISTK